MSKTLKIIAQYWKTIAWVLIIFFLSTLSVPKIPGAKLFDIPHFDKFVHFSLYAILVTLWLIDYFKIKQTFSVSVLWIIVICSILYGSIMEIVQKVIVQDRSGDIFDALANIIGILTAFLLFRYLSFYRKWMIHFLTLKK